MNTVDGVTSEEIETPWGIYAHFESVHRKHRG